MHLRSRHIVVLSLYLLFSSSAYAVDMGGRYLVSGVGKDSCQSYVDSDEIGQSYYRAWLSGYITSYNYYEEDTYSIVNKKSVNDLETWLRGYCFANLDHSFEQAAKGLMRSLKYFKKKNFYDK